MNIPTYHNQINIISLANNLPVDHLANVTKPGPEALKKFNDVTHINPSAVHQGAVNLFVNLPTQSTTTYLMLHSYLN